MTAPTRPNCSRCGEPVSAGARFCMKCGSDVSGEQGVVATAMLPAPSGEADEVLQQLRKATLGEYEIGTELGRGGMAMVYLAHDIALDRKVAIKVMSPALAQMHEGMSERFRREARLAASLSHPNIIPIYTVKSQGKLEYFVMKFVPGRSLDSLIKDLGPLPVEFVRDLLQQVGTALAYAHRHRVFHRDIKPANIMIDEEGWAVVTDFGIAKAADNPLTLSGMAVGTPWYMSPEQCSAKEITGRSDQYSLGVVAYEMLTGQRPFQGDSAMSIMFAHFHEPPRPLAEHRAGIPDAMAAAVMRMLEKAPDNRWPRLEDALAAMGAEPLAPDDPVRVALARAVSANSNRVILETSLRPATSPVPPAKPRSTRETAPPSAPAPASELTITPATASMLPGEAVQLQATLRSAGRAPAPPPGPVSWSSSDPAIATVSPLGVLDAIRPGWVTITATCAGLKAEAEVEVEAPPVAAVSIVPPRIELTEGEMGSLVARVTDASGNELTDRPVSWEVHPPEVGRIGAGAVVTALKAGTAEIRVECEGVRAVAHLSVAPPPVATITVSPAERVVVAGETAAFSSHLADSAGKALTDRKVEWSTLNPEVVAISPRGIVTGLQPGAAEIAAGCEGKEARARVRITPVPVATVTIAPIGPLEVGSETQLTVVLKDGRDRVLSGREVTWSSSSPAVATVTPDGRLTAVAAGTARIAAQSEGKSATVAVKIQPAPKPAPPPEAEPAAPAVPPLVAAAPVSEPAPRAVEPEVAKPVRAPEPAVVSARPAIPDTAEHPVTAPARGRGRLVAALAVGAVLLFAGYLAIRPGPVPPPPPAPLDTLSVSTVIIAGESGPLAVGRTRQLAAVLKNAVGAELQGRKVTWTSSDPAVAEVSGLGAVTGRQAGNATITAASGGVTDEFGVVVEASTIDQPAAVAQVVVSGIAEPLDSGQSRALAATLKDADGKVLADRPVVWSSGNPAIVAVSSTGVVTATAPGEATVSASSEGKSGSIRIRVNRLRDVTPAPAPVVVASVSLLPVNPSITAGQTLKLTAQALDRAGKPLPDHAVTWKSSDESVARIGPDGSLTAVARGSATITAAAEEKSASTRVTVLEAPVAVATVMVGGSPRSLKVGESASLSAVVRDTRGKEVSDRPVGWSSTAPQIATVNSGGVVTGVAAGSAEIRATVEGKSGSLAITVTAAPTPPVPAPGPNVSLLPRREVEAGATFSCGVSAAGAVCWGGSYQGLTQIEGTAGLTGLVVGRTHACGLVGGGRAVCWGENRFGQLGDGTAGTAGAVAPVSADLSFTQLAAGAAHTCGLAGGRAYCWGRNKDGQLGDGSGSDRRKPVAVLGGKTFVALTAGDKHTCGLASTGRAYCWGDGFSGQLGIGAQESQREPIDVSGNLKFSRLAAGGLHTCGVTVDGKAYCWGANESGQLGDGSHSDRVQPQLVGEKVSFTEIAAGEAHTCGLTEAGEAFCWGENKAGQLGDGTRTPRDHPVPVGGGLTFSRISAGVGYTCGLARSGTALCWGRNESGQLGDGTTTGQLAPVPVRQ